MPRERIDSNGFIKIRRTALRRVVGDRLQSLLRGDCFVRHQLSEDDYDGIIKEVKALVVPTWPTSLDNGEEPDDPPSNRLPESPNLSEEVETFVQIIASAIMVDASMRGENAGESDTRKIKKKKKMLAQTLHGPRLGDLRREILRFDNIRSGVEFDDEEIVDSEESDSEDESSSEDESEPEPKQAPSKKRKLHEKPPQAGPPTARGAPPASGDSSVASSQTSDDSDTNTSRSLTEDGLSNSATSSKQKKRQMKRIRKREKKALRREKKRMKKEKKRREKEEKKRKRKLEKELKKQEKEKGSKRRKLKHAKPEPESLVDAEDEGGDESASIAENGEAPAAEDDRDVLLYDISTREDFERYQSDILARVPRDVKSRFREGGFSRWGKDWLPVLELGPFDVEPGPVRDMWLDMLDNTQESGRDLTRLVFWYGVKFVDRGQAFSFVPESKILSFEDGQRKGYCNLPSKIQRKLDKNAKLTKTEEQIKLGLSQIVGDMDKPKKDRAAWMMQFKEEYQLAAETEPAEADIAKEQNKTAKRKPGRPKKQDSDKAKRKPGRPKTASDKDDDTQSKRKPGRPKNPKIEKTTTKSSKSSKKPIAKKWITVDEDAESDPPETDNDDDDRDFGVEDASDIESDHDCDADEDSEREPQSKAAKRDSSKASGPSKGKRKGKAKKAGVKKTDEGRGCKARETQEAMGGDKSKAAIFEEEQMKFTKCEEVFLPMMEELEETKNSGDADGALKAIEAIMRRVDLMTPHFMREYADPLTSLIKTVRKAFEGEYPTVKSLCKTLKGEMKRVYNEKEENIPDGFEPIRNMKDKKMMKKETASDEDFDDDETDDKESVRSRLSAGLQDEMSVKSGKASVKSERSAKSAKSERSFVSERKSYVKSEKSSAKSIATPAAISKGSSETSTVQGGDPAGRKMTGAASTESLADIAAAKPADQIKSKKSFSLKGMFEKPKPTPKPKVVTVPTPPNSIMSSQPSPKPKPLPSWVTGPAMKKEEFHEQHRKERTFGLEFLADAASRTSSSKFDPASVSQSFELAIFAETKLRGKEWSQYWEKIHDVVAMLSPGQRKRNAILQGIIDGDYREPSELVKLSRREIHSLNQLK